MKNYKTLKLVLSFTTILAFNCLAAYLFLPALVTSIPASLYAIREIWWCDVIEKRGRDVPSMHINNPDKEK